MKKLLLLSVILAALAGCAKEDSGTDAVKREPAKPTEQQLKDMPPQASAHASQMSDYAKAQQEKMAKQYGQGQGR